MGKTYLIFGLLLIILLTSCWQGAGNWREDAIEIQARAIKWLVDQQAEDGGWHSQTHGILKGGVAFTAYIADVLVESGNQYFTAEQLDEAILFLYSRIDTSGALGYSNKYVLEYPVYATAYTAKLGPRLNLIPDTTLLPRFETFLISQQFTEQRGIGPAHAAYGAWGFGEQHLPPGEVGHVDLSHTRRVLEALHHNNFDSRHPCWQQVVIFLDRIQNEDGGFCSSSYTLGSNKADDQNHKCVSYATATADGLLALLSLPNPPPAKVRAATQWLIENESWNYPSGIQSGQPGDWDKVLFYYHLSVRSQAYRELEEGSLLPHPHQKEWREVVVATILDHQAEDGSFRNPWGAPNKEDDPLLATALIIRSLNAILKEK